MTSSRFQVHSVIRILNICPSEMHPAPGTSPFTRPSSDSMVVSSEPTAETGMSFLERCNGRCEPLSENSLCSLNTTVAMQEHIQGLGEWLILSDPSLYCEHDLASQQICSICSPDTNTSATDVTTLIDDYIIPFSGSRASDSESMTIFLAASSHLEEFSGIDCSSPF